MVEIVVSGLIVIVLGWLVARIKIPDDFQPDEQFERALYQDAKKYGRRIMRIGLLMAFFGLALIVIIHPF